MEGCKINDKKYFKNTPKMTPVNKYRFLAKTKIKQHTL